LRNVVVSRHVTFYQIYNCFVDILYIIADKISLRPDEMASWTGCGQWGV